jgi:serine protease Do
METIQNQSKSTRSTLSPSGQRRNRGNQGKRGKQGKVQPTSLAIGLAVGVALATAFYAGRQSTQSGNQPDGTKPANQSGHELVDSVRHPAPTLSIAGAKGAIGASTIADIAQEAGSWVVNIDTTKVISYAPQPEVYAYGDQQFVVQQPAQIAQQRGIGSGLIIRADGYILTNNHVVGRADQIKVTLSDKKVFDGQIVGRDPDNDLALVKIDAKNLPVARIGASKNVRPGDWAIAIGSPAGLDHSVTLGIVSALGRSLFEISERGQLIQTDAAINPGNSGGPLLNIQGEVIGINTAVSSSMGGGHQIQNIGFAIPSEVFQDTVEQLLASGEVKRPYVGVLMQELTPSLLEELGLAPSLRGVRVSKATAGGPAAEAGMENGDIVTAVDGNDISSVEQLRANVRSHKVGETVVFQVLRQGKLHTIKVIVGDLKASRRQ